VSTAGPKMMTSTADPGISPMSPTIHAAIGGNKLLL
jgi:pyruvate/2-oxoacid:ferredoxin oxidoreductase alpha subunit